jgi:hypothetical protein
MRMAPHITEVMNRSVTAVAAFDLQYSKLRRQGMPDAMATQLATDYASRAVNETQFNYQTWNKPRLIQRSAAMRTLLMFKQHPQHIYYFMASRAIASSKALTKKVLGQPMTKEEEADAISQGKQLAYFIGMHALMVGAIGGTPEPIKYIIGLLAMLFGDDDEPFDYERWTQQHMKDWSGSKALGDILSRGVLAATGLDMNGRIGINQMAIQDTPSTDNPDAWMADMARIFGGPMASLVERIGYKGTSALRNGDYEAFGEAVLPKALRDPLRAYTQMQEGFTTYQGRPFARSDQLNTYEYAMTALGFTPMETSKIYMRRDVEATVDVMSAKRGDLINAYWLAGRNRDAKVDALRAMDDWNHDNSPVYRIEWKDIVKGVKTRNTNVKNTHGNMLVPKKYLPRALEMADF